MKWRGCDRIELKVVRIKILKFCCSYFHCVGIENTDWIVTMLYMNQASQVIFQFCFVSIRFRACSLTAELKDIIRRFSCLSRSFWGYLLSNMFW